MQKNNGSEKKYCLKKGLLNRSDNSNSGHNSSACEEQSSSEKKFKDFFMTCSRPERPRNL